MVRYHLNPEKGPMRCSAKNACPYGVDAPHFTDKAEAQRAYEASLSETNPFPSHSRAEQELSVGDLLSKSELMSYEDAEILANKSAEAHAMLKTVIDARAVRAAETARILSSLNPRKNPGACDEETFEALRANLADYREQTLSLLEAHHESIHYRPLHSVVDPAAVGRASRTENTSSDVVTGHDVASLVRRDFTEEEQLSFWDRSSFDEMERIKTGGEGRSKTFSELVHQRHEEYSNATWTKYNLDAVARANPNLTVKAVNASYHRSDRPWQEVTFAALVEDGSSSGIVTIHSESDPARWAKGVPMAERAQALYSLNATGLDYALVTVNFMDGMPRTYRVESGEAVWPGKHEASMEHYIAERVQPWIASLRAS